MYVCIYKTRRVHVCMYMLYAYVYKCRGGNLNQTLINSVEVSSSLLQSKI